MLRRRPGFYRVLNAKLEALEAGAPPDEVLKITDNWVARRIGWRETVRELRLLAKKYREKRRKRGSHH